MKPPISKVSLLVEGEDKTLGRREFLKALGASSAALATLPLWPGQSIKPEVESGIPHPLNSTSPRTCSIRRGAAVTSIRDYSGQGFAISSSLQKAVEIGLDVVYHYLGWDTAEPQQGNYTWLILDDILAQVQAYGLKVILRIYNPPNWYTEHGAMAAALSIADDKHAIKVKTVELVRDFMQALTQRVRDRGHRETVAGYVIWNEPNIKEQWDGQAPNPAAYFALLKAAYEGAKAGDPQSVIVSAPLAPTTNTPGVAINDMLYLRRLYDLGLADYVDYVGMNGLGFQHDPDHDIGTAAYNFMRLKYLHDVMVSKGDTVHKVWALEVGWLRDSSFDMGSFEPFKVSDEKQIQYLNRAFEKAEAEWCDWMDLMVIWNLDFRNYYPPTSNFYWYSIIDQYSNQIYLPILLHSE